MAPDRVSFISAATSMLRSALALPPALVLPAAFALTTAASAQHGSQIIMGLPELQARLGVDTPTGAGVVVSQVEAPVSGAYGPNQANAAFVGKTFVAMSGTPGTSSHATTVGKFQYGNDWSIAPGVSLIYLYEANNWLTSGYLRVTSASSVPPAALPAGIKLMNNSWIGSSGSTALDNTALRRADWAMTRDGILMTNGVNNGGASQPLLSHMFNGIAVGIRDGTHTWGDTLAGYDGPGRMKPEIVAPENYSSYCTPMVDAAAAVLVETARTWSGLSGNPDAERSDVLKAVLLAGAIHEDLHDGQWSNDPIVSGPDRGITARPIDPVVGVGTVHIDRSHRILTADEQDGAAAPPTSTSATALGWSLASVPVGGSVYWRFRVNRPADEVAIVATWDRWVRDNFSIWAIADIDLHLWRVGAGGELVSMVGDAGLGLFAGGNVVSRSAVDNVEHLHVTGLAAGDYVLEARRMDQVATPAGPWSVAVAWIFPEVELPEDIDGDGTVGFQDLLMVLAAWGDCLACPEDLNGDGTVDFNDLLMLLSAWTA